MIEIIAFLGVLGIIVFLACLKEYHGIVLTFHSTATQKKDAFTARPKQILKFLGLLRCLGYKSLSPQNIDDFFLMKKLPFKRFCWVAFDDGYSDNLHIIYWLLRHNIAVAIFIPTAHIGNVNSWDEGDKKIMSFEKIQNLIDRGAIVGGHGHHHKRFTEFALPELWEELNASRDKMRLLKGARQDILAYPYGAYNKEILPYIQKAGFKYGFTSTPLPILPNGPPLQMGRLSIKNHWGMSRFILELFLARLRGWKFRMVHQLKLPGSE